MLSRMWLLVSVVEVAYIAVSTFASLSFGWDSIVGELIKSAARLATLLIYAIIAKTLSDTAQDQETKKTSTAMLLLAVLLTAIPAFISVRPQQSTEWMILFSLGSFLVGFREELLYRVLIQTALVKRWSPVVGILVTSALFTVYHVSYFLNGSWLAVGEVFLFSLTIGVLFLVSRSFLLVALVHSFYDLLYIASPFPNQILPEFFLIYLLLGLLTTVGWIFRKQLTLSSP